MKPHRPLLGVPFAVAVSLATAACSSTATTLSAVGDSPGATFSSGGALVPLGVVVGFASSAQSSMPVTAVVDDPTIATVAPTVKGATFVLIGLAMGETTLRVFVNDADSVDVPVQVVSAAQ